MESAMTTFRHILAVGLPLVASIGLSLHVAADGPRGRAVSPAKAPVITYASHVAPILQRNCLSCHRKGEVAPFGLETYEQAKKFATQITATTTSRRMPPWKADSHGEFLDERRLSAAEIQTLAAWAKSGAPLGNRKKIPAPPTFRAGWRLGDPDTVVSMPETYTIGPEGRDIYRCFVLPTNYPEDRWVSAIEVHPGNTRIVHHVIAYLDTSGTARKLDADDEGAGYTSSGGFPGFVPVGALGGWAPGNEPRHLPAGIGTLLPKGADLVIEVHYHRNGKQESDLTSVGIYFSKAPVNKRLRGLAVQQPFLTIPAGAENHKVTATMVVPTDVTAYKLMPHMHVLGQKMVITAKPPGGKEFQLIAVPKWDFNWQLSYIFKEPVKLPKGTVVSLEAYFDNSSKNPFNPNNPPKLVRWGPQTTDEMCVTFIGATIDEEELTKGIPAKRYLFTGIDGL